MPRKKKLPNHNLGISLGSNHFSEEQVTEIINRFGFAESEWLYDNLEEAADRYKIFSSNIAPVNEQKILFKEAAKQSEALLKVLSKLGLQETASIAWYLDRVSTKDELQKNLIKYKSAATSALKKLEEKTSSGGRPKNFARDRLIQDLVQIYSIGLERDPGNAFNEYKKKYQGPLFDFVQYCFDCIGISIKGITLGRKISKAIAEKTSP